MKNHKHSNDPNKENLRGAMYAEPGNPRCPVLGPGVTAFNLNPLKDPKPHLWYSTQPMRKNYLGETLQRLSKAAGLTTRYTNQSLRSTAVRRLSEAGLESRQITSVTGHRCESSLKSYWAPSNTDKKVWSRVLSAPGLWKVTGKPSTSRAYQTGYCPASL